MLRAFPFPTEAGFFTTTLPSLSAFAFRPSFFAVSSTYWVIAASCFEGRGILAISAKYFHTSSGFNPSIAFDTVFLLFSNGYDRWLRLHFTVVQNTQSMLATTNPLLWGEGWVRSYKKRKGRRHIVLLGFDLTPSLS